MPKQNQNRFKKYLVEASQQVSQSSKCLTDAVGTVTVQDEKEIIPNYRDGKNILKVTDKRGESFDTCATISDKYICCNVKVIKTVSNCPYDCSYCFLQNYLNDGTTSVVGDLEAVVEEVKSKISLEPDRLFRIGTWELGDSLALEELTGQAAQLIELFKELPNAILELKTKSDQVDPILNCDHRGKTVVSWSMNTEAIINAQEHRTARLDERLVAIKKVVDAGYLVGLHFDPMIIHENWEQEYIDLIQRVSEVAPPERVAWISVGSLRFNPEMKQKMQENFPASTISAEEMVLGDDGKMRYVKPLRHDMYTLMLNELKKYTKVSDLSPIKEVDLYKPLFYFCMERWDVWETYFGESPTSIQDLDYIFAKHFLERYPDIFPNLSLIKKAYF